MRRKSIKCQSYIKFTSVSAIKVIKSRRSIALLDRSTCVNRKVFIKLHKFSEHTAIDVRASRCRGKHVELLSGLGSDNQCYHRRRHSRDRSNFHQELKI